MTRDDDSLREEARRYLRGHARATLVVDERVLPVRYAVDPVTGEPVLCVPVIALEADAAVLHVPDESPGALQVLGELEALDAARDGACDRWLAYHARADHPRFARMRIDSAKIRGRVVDDVACPNALAPGESALLRWLNADPALIAGLLGRAFVAGSDAPRAVGVDQFGVDVRDRFDIVRAAFPGEADDDRAARAIVLSLCGRAPA